MKIYINDKSEIRGENPSYPFPNPPEYLEDSPLWNSIIDKAKEHSILFEDQERGEKINRVASIDRRRKRNAPITARTIFPQPDTIYTIDLPEVEIVEQFQYVYPGSNLWHDAPYTGGDDEMKRQYRTVYRFVERKEEPTGQLNHEEMKSIYDPIKQAESQEELWDEVYNNGIIWSNEVKLRHEYLLKHFTIQRKTK